MVNMTAVQCARYTTTPEATEVATHHGELSAVTDEFGINGLYNGYTAIR